MSDLIEGLEALADALVGHEWELPITSVEDVRAAIAEIKRLSDELEACTCSPGGCGYWRDAARLREQERNEAREAALWWYRRDQTSHDPSVITNQLELWPWLKA